MLPVMADYLGLLPFPGIGRMIGIILGVILGVVALALSASLLFSALSAPSFTQKQSVTQLANSTMYIFVATALAYYLLST